MREAVCPVCFHHCRLRDGQYGRCRARKNKEGRIICDNYGKITALALDPIEKKPLRDFFPGSCILSAGSYGCNLSCPFCQNYDISMNGTEKAEWRMMTPEELADLADQCRPEGNIGIAFTYNEPLIGYEYVRDTARLIRERGMKNVLVTNGTAELQVLEELLPYIDAMNTDLTPLIVPGEHDRTDEMEREPEWIASVDPKISLHVTRFFPRYRMTDRDATEVETVYRLKDTAKKYLKNVYTGNC